MFCKEGVLRNFAKFTGKHLRQTLFFNKVAGLVAAGCWCFWGPASGGLFYTPSTPLVAAPVYYEQAFSHHAPGRMRMNEQKRRWSTQVGLNLSHAEVQWSGIAHYFLFF